MTRRIISEETRQAILDDYQAGQKLAVIEAKHGVARSTVYWVLEQAGVAPARRQRAMGVKDAESLAALYDMLDALVEENTELKQRLRDLGEDVDD